MVISCVSIVVCRQRRAPWHCSQARQNAIDRLMNGNLPAPLHWTQSFPVFGKRGHQKIAEGLWHFSDAGLYILLLTDIDNSYKRHFADAIRSLMPLFDKTNTQAGWESKKEPIAASLATLEVKLPLYWCQLTHHQPLHAIEKIGVLGSHWATNMLVEERRHRDIRNMATNQKHVLGSIAVNYEMSLQIQMEWRLEEGVSWSVPAEGRSTFAGARPVPEATRMLRPGTLRIVYIDHL